MKKRHLEFSDNAPTEPHILGYDSAQMATSYPIGGMFGMIHDPKRPDYHARMLLVGVKRDRLEFRCVCNPTCRAVITMVLCEVGEHSS